MVGVAEGGAGTRARRAVAGGWDRPGRDHPRGQRAAAGSSAHSHGVRVAGRGAAAHRGHAEAEARAIRDWVRNGAQPAALAQGDSLESLIARFARGRDVSGATTLEELGLSSLERVELMVALEDRFQTRIDEARFSEAASVGDLRTLVAEPAAAPDEADEPVEFPSWNRTLAGAHRPPAVARHLDSAAGARLRPHARRGCRTPAWPRWPVVFASNHQSHMDVPVILAALPGRWRARTSRRRCSRSSSRRISFRTTTRGGSGSRTRSTITSRRSTSTRSRSRSARPARATR